MLEATGDASKTSVESGVEGSIPSKAWAFQSRHQGTFPLAVQISRRWIGGWLCFFPKADGGSSAKTLALLHKLDT